MSSVTNLAAHAERLVECRACPRLVSWRESVARDKRAAYAGEEYWGRPVPGFGDPTARLVILGLAPAAHGGNRTGRIFTGDRSGDWLFGALHRAGFANQPMSVARDDGLVLTDAWVTAAVHCAPPDNKPTIEERDRCVSMWFLPELDLLEHAQVFIALGQFAWDVAWRRLGAVRKPKFSHGARADMDRGTLIGCYHPSQQNTFTGKLTEPMLDAVLRDARACLS